MKASLIASIDLARIAKAAAAHRGRDIADAVGAQAEELADLDCDVLFSGMAPSGAVVALAEDYSADRSAALLVAVNGRVDSRHASGDSAMARYALLVRSA